MFGGNSLFVLLVTLTSAVIAGNYVPELCGGNVVTHDPPIEARQVDGLWYTQGTVSSRPLPSQLMLFQNQGRTLWSNSWNTTTNACSYTKLNTAQLQSVERGPFSPCFTFEVVLPAPTDPLEWALFFPTTNLLMYYRCVGENAEVKPDGSCSGRPFARIMTRTLGMSREEKDIIHKRFLQYGLSIESVKFSDPTANKCRLPMQKERRKMYGNSKG